MQFISPLISQEISSHAIKIGLIIYQYFNWITICQWKTVHGGLEISWAVQSFSLRLCMMYFGYNYKYFMGIYTYFENFQNFNFKGLYVDEILYIFKGQMINE